MITPREAAEELAGTCLSLEEVIGEMDPDSEFCKELDSLVFCCEICSWWYEIDEMADDIDGDELICERCADSG